MVCFKVNYLGTTVVDRRFSSPMVPWVIADIRRRKKVTKVTLVIEEKEIKGLCENDRILFRHNVQKLVRFCCDPSNVKMFLYLVREDSDPLLHCFLYSASDLEDVMEILQTMKESSREHTNWQAPTKSYSSASSLMALCPDISVSNSQFFEVLYVGKIKVSHRNVPQTFIDDALEKINIYAKKSRKGEAKEGNLTKTLSLERNDNGRRSNADLSENDKKILYSGNCASGSEDENGISANRKLLKPSFSHDDIHTKIKLEHSMKIIDNSSTCDTADNCGGDSFPEEPANVIKEDDIRRVNHEMGFRRARAGSLGVLETFKKKTDEYNHNRTMLFYVGKTDLILISPDRKQVLFNKKLKDIVGCVQGLQYNEHFGFICREDECFIGYLFKCECENVADDIVSVITQSFRSNKEMRDLKQPILSCEHCPMVWFHNLCSDIEGMNDKKTQAIILKKIETLPSEEQEIIQTKFLGTESSNVKEQNEFLIILLRTHCETKQTRHVHDTAENRSEFLNHYLGGSTIFTKAKRSLTSSFDHLLKRKGSQLDNLLPHSQSKESNTKRPDPSLHDIDGSENQKPSGTENGKKMVKSGSNPNEIEQLKNHFHKDKSAEGEKKAQGKKHSFQEIAAITINNQKIERNLLQTNTEEEEEEEDGNKESESPKTPMMNIFLKVGSTTKSPENDKFFVNEVNETPSGSWRQVIFNRVVTPGKSESAEEKIVRTRTREELRELWKKAINQQLLLIRMEKENARLKARQEEATVKRIKLEYDDLGSMNKEYIGIWEMISSKDSRLISSKCDQQMLLQAIRQGVPPAKRGDVWHFLAVQYCLKQPPFNSTDFPNYEVPYEDLLKQLTSFQHAILIDLGRTFPNHPYFSSPLGPGQLALFNLLKAYSLLDPQVGYCQGLSFIAGVLLLHMSEEAAFLLLKHLMFRRGIRRQFLPDMAALQVELYQLTRLLYDTLPRLYAHFDRNEIAPTLYAAPWMLTLFASQFPLGFVTRVFDLLFLEHTTDIIFRVILALLEEHMESLLASSTFEEIMSYLKNEIPKMSGVQVEKIMKRVLIMDISKRLREYEVEYHVLQEEMLTPRPKLEELKKLEFENKRLTDQNLALLEQLEIVNKNSNLLERSRSTQQSIINRLEAQIRNLEITIAALGGFISEACEHHKDIIVPGEVRRIISNLEVAEIRSWNEGGAKRVPDRSAMLKKSHTSMGFTEKDSLVRADTLLSELQNGSRFAAKAESVDSFQKRGRSRPTSLRGVPLKVIVDEDDEERKKIGGNSSNIKSKITSGVSLFFNSSQNNGRNNKSKMFIQDNLYNCDSRPGEYCNNENQPTRNFSNEIDTLHISDPVMSGQKETLMRDCKTNCASDLTNTKSETPPVPFHPLDACNDVNITYNGPTKLKSIKSGHKINRSSTTISCE